MRTATKAKRPPKPVSRVGAAGMPELPDTGCDYAPKCLTCPWRACVLQLPADERRIFGLAWRVIESFKAPPSTVSDADGPAGLCRTCGTRVTSVAYVSPLAAQQL